MQAEVQYLHDYAGVTASMGLTTNPVVNMSTVVGTKDFAVGADVSFDTAKANFVKYNAGLSITSADLIAAVNLSVPPTALLFSLCHSITIYYYIFRCLYVCLQNLQM
jgi:voltage-dependent anion channel protein 2